MIKIKYALMATFFILLLSACTPDAQIFSIQLNSEYTLNNIILTDQNGNPIDYEMDEMRLVNISLDGITEIHLSLDGYIFNPNVITSEDLLNDTFVIDVTKTPEQTDPDETTRKEIVHVYNAAELLSALDQPDTKTILFRSDIETDIHLDVPIQLNLNGSTLLGNLTIEMNDTFNLTLSDGTIDD